MAALNARAGGGAGTDPADLALSAAGRRFIYDHERMGAFSRRLYWPKGASGVTLGAGFDMRDRTVQEITDDLQAIGVPLDVAAHAAQGAKLRGADAAVFAKANRGLLTLTADQEIALMEWILPHYVAMVQRSLKRALTQAQFDALVSYAYNPGTGKAWRTVMHDVNVSKDDDAMKEISKQTISHHKIVPSLVKRRADEVKLFQTGDYGKPTP